MCNVSTRFQRNARLFALVAVALLMSPVLAHAQAPVLPELGVEAADLTTYITEVGTRIGAYILGALGVFFAIVVFGIGIKWTRRMVQGRA
jgi:hypothetical protein